MYTEFYKLTENPFNIVPNPNFLFLSSKYQNALTYMEYGLMGKAGFIMLTGEIGIGKTTLIRYLLSRIESEMEIGVIFNTNVSSDEILNLILQEFELDSFENDKTKALDQFYQFLIRKYKEQKQVLIIIDEAQNLSDEALEEIRMLSNLQSDEELLLQIMIVGQPELRKKLKTPRLVQFAQRIAVSYHLSPLTHDETGEYIAHRLKRAGGRHNIFQKKAVEIIFNASGGIPRTINLLCDACLVYGFADGAEDIDESIVEQVLANEDGMGIFTEKDKEEESIEDYPLEKNNEEITSHLKTIETDLKNLQENMDIAIEDMGKKIDSLKAELLEKVNTFSSERKRNENLMREYGLLKGRYNSLKKEIDKLKKEGISTKSN